MKISNMCNISCFRKKIGKIFKAYHTVCFFLLWLSCKRTHKYVKQLKKKQLWRLTFLYVLFSSLCGIKMCIFICAIHFVFEITTSTLNSLKKQTTRFKFPSKANVQQNCLDQLISTCNSQTKQENINPSICLK